MEKIINESKEFRTDNDLRKLSKSQDLSQYLSAARSMKIRLMNADTHIKKLLSENEYEESYYNKYNEELKQLKDSIITCNDRKEALESDLEVRETRKRQKKAEKGRKGGK